LGYAPIQRKCKKQANQLASLLVNVPTFDLRTFVVVAAALVSIAVLASIVPARCAMAVNPTDALRSG
jgi:ABC-type lipoprotein release transport system permease subunit